MKKIVVLILLLGLFAAHHHNIFAALHEHDKSLYEEEVKDRFEEIFLQRAKLFNSLLTENELKPMEIKVELEKLETDPLLSEDVEIFTHIMEEPTCYELINGFNIQEFKVVGLKNSIVMIEVVLLWELMGLNEISFEEITYHVEMIKKQDEWLLMDYRLVR